MKLWLKSDPEITCDTLRDEPLEGGLPVLVQVPNEGPQYAVIIPAEWTDREIVPAPPPVPEQAYLVIYGSDPMMPLRYLVVEKEIDAAIAANTRDDAFGYVPISIQRNAMVEPARTDTDTVTP
jgi:hypothetical protein